MKPYTARTSSPAMSTTQTEPCATTALGTRSTIDNTIQNHQISKISPVPAQSTLTFVGDTNNAPRISHSSQSRQPDCQNLKNATHVCTDTPPSRAMTSFKMGTSFDNEFEHWTLDIVPDPIEPNGIVLSHKTPSRTTGFTQKHLKLQESAVSDQKHPKVPVLDHFGWADHTNTHPISATATTKHPRDLSGVVV